MDLLDTLNFNQIVIFVRNSQRAKELSRILESDSFHNICITGDMRTETRLENFKKFKNFELSVDWKTSKMGNSGIFYYVREVPGKPIYYAAPEVQVLDNVDATDNKLANHLAGSLYDMLPADPKTVKPAGEWNTIVIKVKDGKVTHTQNGKKVVQYTLWSKEWDDMVANSKFKDFQGFQEGISHEGYIGLQDHGYPIWFRNIKIRELK